MKQKIMMLFLAVILCCTFTIPIIKVLAATTITNNATGTIDGYNYELWKDSGNTTMTLNGGGTFSCQWSNINNALFRIGKKFNETQTHQQLGNITVNYACNYKPNGNSYLAIYGWTSNPLVEYYIIESYGTWRPPGNQYSPKGTITIDGGTYEVYQNSRTGPSIKGDTTFQQFWSVRKDNQKRTSGTISVSEHFKAWESKYGMQMGKMYECALVVEGWQSSGSAEVTANTITIGDPPTPTPTKSITVTPTPTKSISVTPTPSRSVIPTKSPSPSPSASGISGYSVSYTQSDWGTGATVSVTIANNGTTAINGWNLGWKFPGNQKITNVWNAAYTQNGNNVSVTNQSYNSAIPAKGSISFGFNISYSGMNDKPASFILNGSSTGATASPSLTRTPVSTPTPIISVKPSATPTAANKFHCFLLLGQSNMAGWPAAQASDKVTNSRILALGYTNNQWAVAVPPLHEAWQGAIGPGDWFAKTIINKLPEGDTIGLIPCAISGEKIETFMKSGGSKYDWIITRAKLAQAKGGVIEGILFHQGCSNNGQTDWPNKVNTLVTDIKKDLGLGDIPVLAGELLYSGSCAGHNTLVNKLPSVVKNCYVISASGLSGDPADSWGAAF